MNRLKRLCDIAGTNLILKFRIVSSRIGAYNLPSPALPRVLCVSAREQVSVGGSCQATEVLQVGVAADFFYLGENFVQGFEKDFEFALVCTVHVDQLQQLVHEGHAHRGIVLEVKIDRV